MNIIYWTGIISLIIQILTGIIDIYILTINVPPKYTILKKLLISEVVIQVIEGSFYVWMVKNFEKIDNITKYRYWDWVFTTPSMLITFTYYLLFLKQEEQRTKIETSVYRIFLKNARVLSLIIILNAFMLLFGYLGELEVLSHPEATFFGFIPFLLYFFLIYFHFAKFTKQGRILFWIFFIIWSIYGVASLMDYELKNTMYNILDLFAKNLFGIFLAVFLFMVRIT